MRKFHDLARRSARSAISLGRSGIQQVPPIRLDQDVLFTTYATLRSDAREEKVSRVQQIIDLLDSDFGGVIVFDESHPLVRIANKVAG